jgi:hypothetical protein
MKSILAGATALLFAVPASAGYFVNYEGPGVQTTTALFTTSGVETFESHATGSPANFSTDFGTAGVINATYSGGRIDPANQYGSSGGTGNNVVTFSNLDPIDISFTTTLEGGLTYFGYWLSALDAGNRIEFYTGGSAGTLLAAITPGDVTGNIGNCPTSYCGNPNPPFLGQNGGEPYAFLNVYFTGGDNYDFIRIYQVGGGGYESDNHTVGFFTRPGGVIPEPATWAMMIAGFGLVGAAARRRNRMVSTLA